MIAGFSALDWPRICQALGRPEWLEDPVLRQPEANRPIVEAALKELLKTEDTRVWIERLEQAGVMCVPINSIAEAIQEWLGLGDGECEEIEQAGVFTPVTPRWNAKGKLPPRLAGWIG